MDMSTADMSTVETNAPETNAPEMNRRPVPDHRHFRNVLGHYPTGVVVVTGLTRDGVPSGMTVGSFTALSLDPPLVAFMAARTSDSWASLQPLGSFCINVLGTHQEHVGRLVAGRKQNKLDDVDWRPGSGGAPIIAGCVATIECELDRILDGGDHEIVIGHAHTLTADNPGEPLVFLRGGYGHFRPGFDDRAANSS